MKCSRCQSRHANPYCYVCRDTDPPRETPDDDAGSLLQTLARVVMTCAMIMAFVAVIAFAAYRMPTHSIAALCIAGFFAFAAAICSRDGEENDETDLRL